MACRSLGVVGQHTSPRISAKEAKAKADNTVDEKLECINTKIQQLLELKQMVLEKNNADESELYERLADLRIQTSYDALSHTYHTSLCHFIPSLTHIQGCPCSRKQAIVALKRP